jgi:hypothetical protein
MRVNINGVWYDAKQIPIQIELTDADKSNIQNMFPKCDNYVTFPDTMKWEEAKKVLKIDKQPKNEQ